ncbi:GNAT family N-acetyltransferase [Flavobacterium columnare]|uniref:GNAT family N-acetyltransferase n=1 Tax=Flavobacterium columnare TaxID=996 RepID=A0A437UC61_9FLAO|nr:GNAT family N-acetyltransferase [Flavobacterium columnare]RVU91207.1 GNAT family N-acetyltransferase [Flavobacterium columnare]
MIKRYINLDSEQESSVKSLIKECEEYDNSVIPVQFDHSLNYFSEMNSWFLYFEEEELIGMISIFNPLSEIAEISGCVKPNKRNKGKFNELIVSSYNELSVYNIKSVLFVVDNDSKAGMGIAEKLNLKCDHIEYLMKYEQFKEKYNSSIQFRDANFNDVDDFIRINSELFHETHEESEKMIMSCLQSNERKQYMAEIDNTIIGICTLFYSDNKVIIYGLGISEVYQGKGHGHDLINSVFSLLKNKNYELELEVDSLNEKAYNLYKKVGFKETRVVNYYEKECIG